MRFFTVSNPWTAAIDPIDAVAVFAELKRNNFWAADLGSTKGNEFNNKKHSKAENGRRGKRAIGV